MTGDVVTCWQVEFETRSSHCRLQEPGSTANSYYQGDKKGPVLLRTWRNEPAGGKADQRGRCKAVRSFPKAKKQTSKQTELPRHSTSEKLSKENENAISEIELGPVSTVSFTTETREDNLSVRLWMNGSKKYG